MREYQVRANTEEGTLVSAVVFATSKMEALEMVREEMKETLNLNLVALSVDVVRENVWQ